MSTTTPLELCVSREDVSSSKMIGPTVWRASGNYGTPFKAGRGVTQGGPLSAKLFNILVDAVAHEWFRELREGGDYEE